MNKYVMVFFIFFPAVLAMEVNGEDNAQLSLHGASWFQFGRIMQSSDTLDGAYRYDGMWLQSAGAQFTVKADIGDHWDGAMGLGGFKTPTSQAIIRNIHQSKPGFFRYVTEANFSYYYSKDPEFNPVKLTMGQFPYVYNTDIRNLGAYLFRGPVYPGFLFSGFRSEDLDTTISNSLGMKISSNFGNFKQDILFISETDLPPYFDFSLGYVASYNIGGVFELGAGVNFYHFVPIKSELTKLTDEDEFRNPKKAPPLKDDETVYDHTFAYVNVSTDTVLDALGTPVIVSDTSYDWLSHQGIKLMGRFSFDPKPLLGLDMLGPHDLKLYGEAAIIGIEDYTGIYDDIMERIPVMVGFNFPAFGFLDVVALEIEWYGARFRNDYYKLVNTEETLPVPQSDNDYERYKKTILSNSGDSVDVLSSDTTIAWSEATIEDMHDDDIKWSLYLSKTVMDHTEFCFQIANDHYRPYQYLAGEAKYETAFTKLSDYYFMFRVGYKF